MINKYHPKELHKVVSSALLYSTKKHVASLWAKCGIVDSLSYPTPEMYNDLIQKTYAVFTVRGSWKVEECAQFAARRLLYTYVKNTLQGHVSDALEWWFIAQSLESNVFGFCGNVVESYPTPHWARYKAKEESGIWYAYEEKPILCEEAGFWVIPALPNGGRSRVEVLTGHPEGIIESNWVIAWTQSLAEIERTP